MIDLDKIVADMRRLGVKRYRADGVEIDLDDVPQAGDGDLCIHGAPRDANCARCAWARKPRRSPYDDPMMGVPDLPKETG